MRKVLQEIIEKKHDVKTCKYNLKENGNVFNQEPTPCLFFDGARSYRNLLQKVPERPESINTNGIVSANDDENSKMIADFRNQLTIMEDINDEILIGCRKQEDQATKGLKYSLQTV